MIVFLIFCWLWLMYMLNSDVIVLRYGWLVLLYR